MFQAQTPTGPPSLWFKRLPSKSRRSAVQILVFRNLVYELTAGQVGTGSAWKLYTCRAAATLVSGTRVAPGLHPGTPTGVKVFQAQPFLGNFPDITIVAWQHHNSFTFTWNMSKQRKLHVEYTSTNSLSSPTNPTVQQSVIWSKCSHLTRLVFDTDGNQLPEHWQVTQSMGEMPGSCMTLPCLRAVKVVCNSMQVV